MHKLIRQKNQTGSILIEALMSIVLFAVVLFGLIEFQGILMRDRTLIDQKTEALIIAESQMEIFRNYTVIATTAGQFAYDDIVTCSATPTCPATVVGKNTTYTVTWTVTTYTTPAAGAPIRKEVNIQVAWTDTLNVSQTVAIDSIIVRIEPANVGKVSSSL